MYSTKKWMNKQKNQSNKKDSREKDSRREKNVSDDLKEDCQSLSNETQHSVWLTAETIQLSLTLLMIWCFQTWMSRFQIELLSDETFGGIKPI